ncbi:MAG TPA: YceI family protein [Myxococcaceae bacterium]
MSRPAVAERWLLLGALLPFVALGQPRSYRVAPPAEGSKAEAVVVYSLGSHTQVAQDIRGEVTLDPTTLAGGSGSVVVPIAGIHGDGGTRDCHMREALGIDYAAGGRFPNGHVCDGQNRLPASGPESVAFPDIRLEILGARPLDAPGLLESGKPVRVELDARWTLHGVARQQKELTRVVREGDGLHVRGRSTIVLADHGIVVKATKVLFTEIKVGDAVTVTYDLRLVNAAP